MNTEELKANQLSSHLDLIFSTENISIDSMEITITYQNMIQVVINKVRKYTESEHEIHGITIEYDSIEILKTKNISVLELIMYTQLCTRVNDMISLGIIPGGEDFDETNKNLQIVVSSNTTLKSPRMINDKYFFIIKDKSEKEGKYQKYTLKIFLGKRDEEGKVFNKRERQPRP